MGKALLSGVSQVYQQGDAANVYIPTGGQMQSAAAAPIWYGQKRIGVINVECYDDQPFTADDIQLLESLAAQAGTAIVNAQQYADLRAIKGAIGNRTALEWLEIVRSTWSHSIRRDVGVALTRLELLRHELGAQTSEGMLRETEALRRAIGNLGAVAIIEPLGADEKMHLFSLAELNQLLEQYVQRRSRQEDCRWVIASFEAGTSMPAQRAVRVSREWLRQALDILVDNSLYAMTTAGSPVKRLVVATATTEAHVRIAVRDSGPGVPGSVQQILFEKPVEKEAGSRGSGLGLMLAQMIVETYDGKIHLESTGPTGTVMVVEFPLEAGGEA
jgi:signal transduction histidine kinase